MDAEAHAVEMRMDVGSEECSDKADDVVYGDAINYDSSFLFFGRPH
jgi:hypothetical protein